MATKTKVDKKMEGAELAASSSPSLKALFDTCKKKFTKAAVNNIYSLEEYAESFPIERCLSSGLLVLDLNMFKNKDGTEWGAACGRWHEISGTQNIGKTLLGHRFVADALRKRGMGFWVQAEGEFDADHAMKTYADLGVDVSNPADINLMVLNATSVEDLYTATDTILNTVEAMKKEFESQNKGKSFRKESPPIVVVVDSLAAIVSSIDREGIEEKGWEKRTRMGSKASEFHSYFQMLLNRFAELGVCGIGTNHLRASMDAYGPDTIPAHDSSLKYYMSFRMKVDQHPKTKSKYAEMMMKNYSNLGRASIAGHSTRFIINKIRGMKVEDGMFEIPFFNGYGFDFYYAMVDGALTVGLLRPAGKSGRSFIPTRKEILDYEPYKKLVSLLPDREETIFTSEFQVRDFLSSNDDAALLVMDICYRFGPEPPPDRRGKKPGESSEDEE